MGMPDRERPQFAYGDEGVIAVATYPDAEVVVTGIVGCAGETFDLVTAMTTAELFALSKAFSPLWQPSKPARTSPWLIRRL
jgi:1-deoxy-D-xylulose 5-phosphate reductoisomerase